METNRIHKLLCFFSVLTMKTFNGLLQVGKFTESYNIQVIPGLLHKMI